MNKNNTRKKYYIYECFFKTYLEIYYKICYIII